MIAVVVLFVVSLLWVVVVVTNLVSYMPCNATSHNVCAFVSPLISQLMYPC
jgi:hypothetical protein